MKMLFLLAGLLLQGIAIAETVAERPVDLSYSYAELRFVDVDLAAPQLVTVAVRS